MEIWFVYDGRPVFARLRKRNFTTAAKQMVTRETGYAILSAEGCETVDEVVFAEPSDIALLGVRTIEGFGVRVRNIPAINTKVAFVTDPWGMLIELSEGL